jgi:hypothetical protein
VLYSSASGETFLSACILLAVWPPFLHTKLAKQMIYPGFRARDGVRAPLPRPRPKISASRGAGASDSRPWQRGRHGVTGDSIELENWPAPFKARRC